MTIRREVILLYCVVLAPKPVGRRANLSGDELIPLLGGASTGLFVCRPWRARSWSLRGQSGRRRRLAVAQECSDGYYCQPPPQSDTGKMTKSEGQRTARGATRNVTVVRLTI